MAFSISSLTCPNSTPWPPAPSSRSCTPPATSGALFLDLDQRLAIWVVQTLSRRIPSHLVASQVDRNRHARRRRHCHRAVNAVTAAVVALPLPLVHLLSAGTRCTALTATALPTLLALSNWNLLDLVKRNSIGANSTSTSPHFRPKSRLASTLARSIHDHHVSPNSSI